MDVVYGLYNGAGNLLALKVEVGHKPEPDLV